MSTVDAGLSPRSMAGDARPSLDGLAGVKSRVPSAEWGARVELAALYRLVHHFGWTDLILNHISLRLPDEEAFLVNPFGLTYDEITASSLVKVDLDGSVLDDPTGMGINGAGFVIHGAIHAARPDVTCVLHTHTRAGCAVAAQSHGLLPVSQQAAAFYGRVGYHDFEGVVVDLDERSRLVSSLGRHPVLILRNHGLLTAGRSAGEAFTLMHRLERACEIQLSALSAGIDNLTEISPAALHQVGRLASEQTYDRDWAAMLRLVERVAPDYNT